MKKLISIAAAISMLAAMPAVTAFAESPASSELTNEERVAEGIAAYERELEHLKTVKSVSEQETIERWNAYIADFNERYLKELDANQSLKKYFLECWAEMSRKEKEEEAAEATAAQGITEQNAVTTTQAAQDTAVTTTTTSPYDDYSGLDVTTMSGTFISPEIVNAVRQSMPADRFEEMVNSGNFALYYIDGALLVVSGVPFQGGAVDESAQFQLELYYTEPYKIDWDIDKLEFTTLTGPLKNVLLIQNEQNRQIDYIVHEMTEMGLWNVEPEEVMIPYNPEKGPQEVLPLSSNPSMEELKAWLDSLPHLFYDLTSGDDTYHIYDTEEPVFAIINERGNGETGNDTLFLDYDTDKDSLEFLRIGKDLFINDLEHEVYVICSKYFSDPAKRIENIRFRDKSVMSFKDICDITNCFVGTEEDDTLEGYPETNYIWGMGGNDTIYGNRSDDYMLGGDGDDTITLADSCFGLLFTEAGNNYAYGMNGNDTIILSDGDDFIWGGKGDDVIKSGSGRDIIYYELGDGNDYIDDTTGRFTYPESGKDVLWLGEGILPDQVQVSFSDNYYEYNLHIMRTGDTITIPGNMYSGLTPVFPIEEIHFADGTTWNRLDLLERTRYHYGSNEDDVLTAVVDTDAEFRKDYTPDAVLFGFGGNDVLTGAKGNDIIWGGTGDDIMRGGNGDDIFYYDFGDGNDLIDLGKQGGNNILLLGEGIEPDEVTIERSVDDYTYILHINATGETVSIAGNVMGYFDFNFPMKAICFDDGTVWDQEYLQANFVKYIRGTDGDDTINDTGDNDTVFCGKGNDFIKGRSGDDLYIYELGDGCDTIDDSTLWGNGYNTLQFGEGISLDDIYIENSEYDGKKYTRFYIRDRESYVQVIGINEVIFADGGSMTFDEFKNAVRSASELS